MEFTDLDQKKGNRVVFGSLQGKVESYIIVLVLDKLQRNFCVVALEFARKLSEPPNKPPR